MIEDQNTVGTTIRISLFSKCIHAYVSLGSHVSVEATISGNIVKTNKSYVSYRTGFTVSKKQSKTKNKPKTDRTNKATTPNNDDRSRHHVLSCESIKWGESGCTNRAWCKLGLRGLRHIPE